MGKACSFTVKLDVKGIDYHQVAIQNDTEKGEVI
jgi:hypothetical protein